MMIIIILCLILCCYSRDKAADKFRKSRDANNVNLHRLCFHTAACTLASAADQAFLCKFRVSLPSSRDVLM